MFTFPNMRARAAAVAAAMTLVSACALDPVDLEGTRPLPLRSSLLAADGTVLVRLFEQNRSLVRYDAIPPVLVDAVLAAEDARFFEHEGFDVRSIARAAVANLEEGEVVQGGSTITQQYVKNVYFRHPDRSFERKARELRLAIEAEGRYSKEEILERYLNTIYFGEGAYGIKAAAETYFGRGVGSISKPQAALLAGLIKAPALYDPRDHPRRARRRRNYVLDRMAELGHIGERDLRRARRAPLGITSRPPKPAVRQPYFVEAVKNEVLQSSPPTIATMAPVRGSIATSAAAGSPGRLSTPAMACSAARWNLGSSVVVMRSPPLNSARALSCSVAPSRPSDSTSFFTASTK
jgi:penicillin-binding protein 1A